ncbi:MAG: hypothetical protein A2Y03_04105 [Omnitrophica WOR_2 bacterium GWF2_38_59]|nr:MAG: hypothetical protein A2Y03_04105 [Omnitrophica WOR_2 bacterium GWF2_38_59]OGX52807.1 MAG: hypothetical protein A2267_07610 [Omnitrophica WOR_2 bacterium RIFOXYA12_FULL_38_10]OGX57451.1 MAG: hypothetical protein A2306_02995 [Omnitrophica WOR_2 bacterium RIFOXYB2_FULL_38_16]OGX57495.1 MAG: hypothetical protein A2447_03405 [Omnitrophica WOR_2 bacterium RIFOXYC2_FULL_38_12]
MSNNSNTSVNSFVEEYNLPKSYDFTNATLIVRDPEWVHAYWEVSDSSLNHLISSSGNNIHDYKFILRFYDVTLIDFNGYNANHHFDIDVGNKQGSWYLNLTNSNVTYCCDVGIINHDGEFHTLARSNFVTTHQKGNRRNDMIWMEVVDGKSKEPYAIINNKKQKLTAPDALPAEKKKAVKAKRPPLSVDKIKDYYAKLFPIYGKVRGLHRKRRMFGLLGGSPSLGKLSLLQIKDKEKLARGVFDIEEALLKDLPDHFYSVKIPLGASGEFELSRGGSHELVKNNNEFLGASEANYVEEGRKFYFEIGTELIVYGRTEPDAQVTLGGQNIKLREDGTFTLRYALPDGKIPFDFIATSSDKKESRNISTSVERTKTMYCP